MITFKKGDFLISFEPQPVNNPKGLILKVSSNRTKDEKIFSLIPPGYIYLFEKDQWELINTSTIKAKREYRENFDKESVNLIEVITRFPINKSKLILRQDEAVVLEAVTYDIFRGNLDWLPNYGQATLYEFAGKQLIVHTVEEGMPQREEFDMPAAVGTKVVSYEAISPDKIRELLSNLKI